jgi:hypothetical protein
MPAMGAPLASTMVSDFSTSFMSPALKVNCAVCPAESSPERSK